MDEPTNGELGRRLDELARIMREAVGRPEYGEFQRGLTQRLDRQFADFTIAISDLRRSHDDDIKDMLRRLEDAEADRRKTIRDRLYDGLIPTLLCLATFLGALYIARGGK